jgi:hypothetical protein
VNILCCSITRPFKIFLATKMSIKLSPCQFSSYKMTTVRSSFKIRRATRFWIFCAQITRTCRTKYLKLVTKRLRNRYKTRQHASSWCIISHSFTTAKSVCCCVCAMSHSNNNCKQSNRKCACSSSCRHRCPTI